MPFVKCECAGCNPPRPVRLCTYCTCRAETSRNSEPVCYHHADEGLDGSTCWKCDGPAMIDVSDVENQWPDYGDADRGDAAMAYKEGEK